MSSRPIKARKALREWRRSQTPRMTQSQLGGLIGKTGALVGMFERGEATLVPRDCLELRRITGIPLNDFMPRDRLDEARNIARHSEPAV